MPPVLSRAARPGTSPGPETIDKLEEALAWAARRGVAVEAIGLGSNVLAHDAGLDAVVLRLGGELAAAGVEASCSSPAAGRRTPSAFTALVMRASAVSSSPRRSPGLRAAESG